MDLLVEQIDKKKTIKKTKKFLEKDFRLLINYSGMPVSDLSSPLLDPTGVHGSKGINHAEIQFMHDIAKEDKIKACENAVKAVVEAINSCADTEREPYKTILFRRYVKNDFDLWIYQDLQLSKSSYIRMKKSALLELAQRIGCYRNIFGAQGLIPKLLYLHQ